MLESKCLYCYKAILDEELFTPAGQDGFHPKCSKKFFGTIIPPKLAFTRDQVSELAKLVIKSQKVITGVQPKLSLGFDNQNIKESRLTIVGLYGQFILKPQTETYPSLPEIEDLTMHLAELSKINTVKHTLIRLKSGEIAYLTKRVDRTGNSKIHMEDMCQLTERLTEHKYRGSYEQIAKVIKKYATNPGLDLSNFFEVVIFSFLTGNNDMHLKNFSLIKKQQNYMLCPAYDLVASELVIEGDEEELALTLNGKKRKLSRKDFEIAMEKSGLDKKVISNIFRRFSEQISKWEKLIDESFLSEKLKTDYKSMIKRKAKQIEV
ncbi:HipA domain-containing protein [Pedobacter glucosidilyticus]|uniref:HipA domain-containing protein n=1 Tax=Pedobacter glucosidilyticus TaxID=1122941 RepID=UPI00042385FF|nr:HipA domain-containing protein [Pedobacter glucosidilyticus]